MPYTKSPRPYRHEYQMQKKRGEHDDRMERQRARRKYDKDGIDRTGKDIDHVKPLRAGGKSTAGNTRLRSRKANQSDNGH